MKKSICLALMLSSLLGFGQADVSTTMLCYFPLNGNASYVGTVDAAKVSEDVNVSYVTSYKFGSGAFKASAGSIVIADEEKGLADFENGWTISLWFHGNGMADWGDVFGFKIGNFVYKLECCPGKFFQIFNLSDTANADGIWVADGGKGALDSKIEITRDAWHHLVIQSNSAKTGFDIYIDGVFNQSFESNIGALWGGDDYLAALTKVVIGVKGTHDYRNTTHAGVNGRASSALVDDLAIYGSRLSLEQISYLASLPPKDFDAYLYSRAISVNFGADKSEGSMADQEGYDGSLAGEGVLCASWNDLSATSASDVAITNMWDGEKVVALEGVTVSYSCDNRNWTPKNISTSRFLNGYIDDAQGHASTISVKNIPFHSYDLIVYYQGDDNANVLGPVEVNGRRYSMVNGKAVRVNEKEYRPTWGNCNRAYPQFGINAIKITRLCDEDIVIKPAVWRNINGVLCRGTVAAIQIIESDYEVTSINRNDVFSASLAEVLKTFDNYTLTVPDGGIFNIDAELTRHYDIVSDGSIRIEGDDALKFAGLDKLHFNGVSGTVTVGVSSAQITRGDLYYEVNEGGVLSYSEILPVGVRVNKGGVFNVNGRGDVPCPIKLNGGTLTNTGSAIGEGLRQWYDITLENDSFIDAVNSFGMIAPGFRHIDFASNGHTLTKRGQGGFWFSSVAFVGGCNVVIDDGFVSLIYMPASADESQSAVFYGSGTIKTDSVDLALANLRLDASWTGTVELGAINVGSTRTAFDFSRVGNENSTIVLKGISGNELNKYLVKDTYVRSSLRIDGSVTFDNGDSSQLYRFSKIFGAGNLSLLDWTGNNSLNIAGHGYKIDCLEDYTGVLTTTRHTVIEELSLSEEPRQGEKILSLGSGSRGHLEIKSVKVGGAPASFVWEMKEDGVYRVIEEESLMKPGMRTSELNQDITELFITRDYNTPLEVIFDAPIPSGVTEVIVRGNVKIVYEGEGEASSVPIRVDAGSSLELTGFVVNKLKLAANSTLITTGETIIAASISTVDGSAVIVRNGSLYTSDSTNYAGQWTVNEGASLVLPKASHVRFYGINLELYGLLDATKCGEVELWSDFSNLKLYAGAKIIGTNSCAFKQYGGYNYRMYVKNNPTGESNEVVFDAPLGVCYFETLTEFDLERGMVLKFKKNLIKNIYQGWGINGRGGTLYLNGGTIGFDVEANETLTVDARVRCGQPLYKWGHGALYLKEPVGALDEGVFLVDGTVRLSAANADVTVVSGSKGRRLARTENADGSIVYSLSDTREITFNLDEGYGEWQESSQQVSKTDGEHSVETESVWRSGKIGDNESSTLKTNVSGKGKLEFWWRVSCESFRTQKLDYLAFLVDGVEVEWINGEKDWAYYEYDIASPGEHEIGWVYNKDEQDSDGEDCGAVCAIFWTPAPKPSRPEAIEGASAETQAAFDAWAQKYGVSNPSAANVNAFMLGFAPDATGEAIQAMVEAELKAIDFSSLVGGDITAAVGAIQAKYPNAAVELAPVNDLETSAHLYKLVIKLK